jgi:hypothetical protein
MRGSGGRADRVERRCWGRTDGSRASRRRPSGPRAGQLRPSGSRGAASPGTHDGSQASTPGTHDGSRGSRRQPSGSHGAASPGTHDRSRASSVSRLTSQGGRRRVLEGHDNFGGAWFLNGRREEGRTKGRAKMGRCGEDVGGIEGATYEGRERSVAPDEQKKLTLTPFLVLYIYIYI